MKFLTLFLFIILCNDVALFAQQKRTDQSDKDSIYLTRGNLVPILAFDPDNGFRYGATVNIFRINRKEIVSDRRPFSDNLFLRGFHSTKKNFQSVLLLETNSIFRKSKCFIEFSAAQDASFEFFGINGYNSIYNGNLIENDDPEFVSENFYKHAKKLYKFRFDYQKELGSPFIRLLNGLTVASSKLSFDSTRLIYDYLTNNLLEYNPNGQKFFQYNLGLIAENRNNQFYCTKGYWHEAMIIISSDFKGQHFAKSAVTFRNYIPIRNKRTILMSRLSFQNKLFGEIPYEFLSQYYDSRLSSDGLGGIFTMRGKPRNRMLSDGFILNNLELKRSVFQGSLLKNNISLELSFFIDQLLISQRIKIKDTTLPPLYDANASRYSVTCGFGGYIVLNESSVITINYGTSVLKNEHGGRLYIGAGFMF